MCLLFARFACEKSVKIIYKYGEKSYDKNISVRRETLNYVRKEND